MLVQQVRYKIPQCEEAFALVENVVPCTTAPFARPTLTNCMIPVVDINGPLSKRCLSGVVLCLMHTPDRVPPKGSFVFRMTYITSDAKQLCLAHVHVSG